MYYKSATRLIGPFDCAATPAKKFWSATVRLIALLQANMDIVSTYSQ